MLALTEELDHQLESTRELAKRLGADFIHYGPVDRERVRTFRIENEGKVPHRDLLLRALRKTGHCPVTRYNLEYGVWNQPEFRSAVEKVATAQDRELRLEEVFDRPQYHFFCDLLDPTRFAAIVGAEEYKPTAMTLDVGCGFGQLLRAISKRRFAVNQHVKGIDLSPLAINQLATANYDGFAGTLPAAYESGFVTDQSVALLLLSYFIDRDADQRSTFETAAKILTPGGKIVLEGLFPVKLDDTIGTVYATDKTRQITAGESIAGDIQLIAEFFWQLGMTIERITTSERLVYTFADQIERLSSTFLTISK